MYSVVFKEMLLIFSVCGLLGLGFFPQGRDLTEMTSPVDGIFINYKKLKEKKKLFKESFCLGESHTK